MEVVWHRDNEVLHLDSRMTVLPSGEWGAVWGAVCPPVFYLIQLCFLISM